MKELKLLISFVKAVDYQIHGCEKVSYSCDLAQWFFDGNEIEFDDLYDILIKEISLMNERTEELLQHIEYLKI
jgi:hypothetical protein